MFDNSSVELQLWRRVGCSECFAKFLGKRHRGRQPRNNDAHGWCQKRDPFKGWSGSKLRRCYYSSSSRWFVAESHGFSLQDGEVLDVEDDMQDGKVTSEKKTIRFNAVDTQLKKSIRKKCCHHPDMLSRKYGPQGNYRPDYALYEVAAWSSRCTSPIQGRFTDFQVN